jgi:hypothetical protein
MGSIGQSILFAAASALFLAGGVVTHVMRFKRGLRTPVRVLRGLYTGAVICAGVGLLLFGDYLFA